MKYVGSKNSIAKYILQYVLSERIKDQWYIEPFVGGANIIDKVHGNRIGADANYYLIECLKLIRDDPNILPKDKTEANEVLYRRIKSKENITVPDGLYGYYGFALSYSGKWWGGWCRDSDRKRDYVKESYKNALEQSIKLKGIELLSVSYNKLEIPNESIIYCDPPYKNTVKYFNGEFNHDEFWEWVRNQVEIKHKVYVSEYQAPDDFIPIWAKTKNNTLDQDTGSKKDVEKLFIHESQQGSLYYF